MLKLMGDINDTVLLLYGKHHFIKRLRFIKLKYQIQFSHHARSLIIGSPVELAPY
jgi:hypothetical protein